MAEDDFDTSGAAGAVLTDYLLSLGVDIDQIIGNPYDERLAMLQDAIAHGKVPAEHAASLREIGVLP